MLRKKHWLIWILIPIMLMLASVSNPRTQPAIAARLLAAVLAPTDPANAGPLGMGTPANTATPSPTPLPAWAPNTAYSVGQRVEFHGISYRCLQAHTSRVGWEPPNAPALWGPIPTATPAPPTPTRACQLATGTPQPSPTGAPPLRCTPTPANPPTVTRTPSPTATFCPQATPEPLWVEPVTSPTDQLSQVVTVRIGNGEAVSITTESGTFTTTGTFNASANPARVTVQLLPGVTHHLHVTARVRRIGSPGGCQFGGYSLSTDRDRLGAPLTIVQQSGALPDLTVTRIQLVALSPLSCGAPSLVVRVHLFNSGTAPAGSFIVDLNGVRQTVAAGLAAGQQAAISFQGPRSGTVTAFVDAALQVAEQREDNNRLTTILPVSDPPPPCTPTPRPRKVILMTHAMLHSKIQHANDT